MQTGLGGPGKTWKPLSPPSACFSHTLTSLGPAVLTLSSPSIHSAWGALETPTQNMWHSLRHVVVWPGSWGGG